MESRNPHKVEKAGSIPARATISELITEFCTKFYQISGQRVISIRMGKTAFFRMCAEHERWKMSYYRDPRPQVAERREVSAHDILPGVAMVAVAGRQVEITMKEEPEDAHA